MITQRLVELRLSKASHRYLTGLTIDDFRRGEDRRGEVRPLEVRLGEVHPLKIRPLEACLGEARRQGGAAPYREAMSPGLALLRGCGRDSIVRNTP